MALRRIACLVALVVCVLSLGTRQVSAAAQVHRLSLVLSSNPTSIAAGDVNEQIKEFNRIRLQTRGLEDVETIGFGWFYQAEMRYFVRPNLAASFGVGHLRSISRREFLPRISQRINLRAEIISVPIHAGATYYLAPYNQGDFQARAYLGGGFMALTNNKFVFESLESATDSSTTLGGSFRTRARRDAPGFYLEAGAHMFFAVRYSVMLGVIYRSAQIRDMIVTQEFIDEDGVVTRIAGAPTDMDVGGLGARMGVAIGF